MGLEADDIIVHASLSSLGWVDGGPETVVEDGTVVFPTFAPHAVREVPFDPETAAFRMGAVIEVLAELPCKTGRKEVLVDRGDQIETIPVARVGCGRRFPSLKLVAREKEILMKGND